MPFLQQRLDGRAGRRAACGHPSGGAGTAAGIQAGRLPPSRHAGRSGGDAGVDAGNQEPPRILYEGTPSWKAQFWRFVGAAAAVAVGLGGGVVLYLTQSAQGHRMAYLIGGGAIAAVGAIWYLVLSLGLKSRRVRITSATIDIERGVFGRTIHTVQLWRVHDVDYEQTFGERLMGLARIHVLSQDEEMPKVTLFGLPGSRVLFESLKDAIAIARQSKNVMGMVR